MLGKLSGRGPTGLRPFFMPLFTQVRRTGILRTSPYRLSRKFVLKAVRKGRCSPHPPCGPPLRATEPMISSFLFLSGGPLIAQCAMTLAQLASLFGMLHSTTVSIIIFDVWVF
jgi:hypothetical protein